MHNVASSLRGDKWSGRARNKQEVNLSSNALKPVADVYPSDQQSPQEQKNAIVERIDSSRVFFTTSPAMLEVFHQIKQVAAVNAPVLLVGESGTGKELVARLIHKLSGRASHDFLKVNCAAFPAEPLESELFGHDAGAFPGATSARTGKFEAAENGTLLLEDIGAIPMSSQPRLLHVMQEGEFARLGASFTKLCDVRLIATTDVDLRQAVLDGAIRADLYYRLNGFTIHVPPLRQHKEDLPYLLDHFMNAWSAEYKRPRLPITRRILDSSAAYSWPGNIHELESFVKRYLVLGDEKLALDQLETEFKSTDDSAADSSIRINLTGRDICDLKSVVRDLKHEAEKAAILQALERTNGNKQEAAGLLHISLRALHYKVRAYGIESASIRSKICVDFPDAALQKTSLSEDSRAGRLTNAAGKVLTMARTPVR